MKEEDTYIEHIKTRLYHAVDDVNSHADSGNFVKNKISYGSAVTLAWIMQDFGYDTELDSWEEDNGNIRIAKITINGDIWVEFWNRIPHELPIDVLID